MRELYFEKFMTEECIFTPFIPATAYSSAQACGEPQYLVKAMINYVRAHPKAFFDTELLQVWTLGVAPYSDEKFKDNFRHKLIFIGNNTRDAVNQDLLIIRPFSFHRCRTCFQKRLCACGCGTHPDIAPR